MRADEGVLGDFLGVTVVAEMAEREQVHISPMARDDLGKRGFVPGIETANELVVVRRGRTGGAGMADPGGGGGAQRKWDWK